MVVVSLSQGRFLQATLSFISILRRGLLHPRDFFARRLCSFPRLIDFLTCFLSDKWSVLVIWRYQIYCIHHCVLCAYVALQCFLTLLALKTSILHNLEKQCFPFYQLELKTQFQFGKLDDDEDKMWILWDWNLKIPATFIPTIAAQVLTETRVLGMETDQL